MKIKLLFMSVVVFLLSWPVLSKEKLKIIEFSGHLLKEIKKDNLKNYKSENIKPLVDFEVKPSQVQVRAHLMNPTPIEKSVLIQNANYTHNNPFSAHFRGHNDIRFSNPPEAPPSVPEMFYQLIIQPQTEIIFTETLSLDDMHYKGRPTIKVFWSFSYALAEPVSGELEVKLPEKN